MAHSGQLSSGAVEQLNQTLEQLPELKIDLMDRTISGIRLHREDGKLWIIDSDQMTVWEPAAWLDRTEEAGWAIDLLVFWADDLLNRDFHLYPGVVYWSMGEMAFDRLMEAGGVSPAGLQVTNREAVQGPVVLQIDLAALHSSGALWRIATDERSAREWARDYLAAQLGVPVRGTSQQINSFRLYCRWVGLEWVRPIQ